MAGYDLGKAYINIVPRTAGMGKAIEKELGGAGSRAASSKNGLGGKLWGGLKAGAVGAGVAIGGILTGSVVKGFQRLSAIEDAEAKLAGLGNSASDVQAIMDNALAAVKGTAFGMDEAATTAASAVAAGIKPGKELESYLSLVGDAASIAGTDMASMGSIFNKVATSGKVQGDVFAQLGDAGIPIVTLLAEEMGVTAEEVYKLGSAGKIGTDQFLAAMSSMEGAALESGKTTSGAWKNMGAAMSRFGAALLEDVYPFIAPVLGKVTELFDYLTDAAGPAIQSVMDRLKPFANGLKGIYDVLFNGNFTGADNLFGFEEDSAFVGFLFGVRDVAIELYERALKPLGSWIADNWKPIAAALGGIAAFFVGGALVSAIGAVAAAIGSFVAGISWIGVAVGAAVGAVTWFFTQTEAGRGILERLVSFVRDTFLPGVVGAFGLVRDFVVGQLWPMLKSRFEAIRDLAVQVWQGVIQPAIEQFVGYVRDTMFPIIQRLWQEYVQPAFMAIGALAVWLWENAVKPAMSAIDNFIGNILGPAIVWLWKSVVSPIFGLIGQFIGWVWNTLIFPYLDSMKYVLTVILPPALQFLWEVVKTVWSGISTAISATVTWFRDTAWPAISSVIEWVKTAFNVMRDGIKAAWAFVRDNVIAPVVSWFKTWVWPVIEMVIALIKLGFNQMRDSLMTAWYYIRDNVIQPVVSWFKNTAWPLISTVIEAIKLGFNVMRDSLQNAWRYVRDSVIQPVISWFKNVAWPLLSSAIDSVKTGFNTMRDSIKNAWNFVRDRAIRPVANWFRDTIRPLFDKTTDRVGDAFKTMKDTIKTAWEAVKTAAKAPIKFVVETVVNDALVGNFNKVAEKLGTSKLPSVSLPSGFARGGVLPGWSRMSDGDDQLVPMRRGEGVLVSEGLRTRKDRQAFLAANAAGRRGIGFASLMQGGFAGGGILGRAWDGIKGVGRSAKSLAGDALDAVLDGVDFVAEALKDPSSIFKKVYNAVVGEMPGFGNMVSMAKGAGSKILSGAIDSVMGFIAPAAEVPAGAAKAGGSLGKAQALASSYGLTMTSFRRPGARTAGSGVQSLHALGRAMDFSNSSGPTPQMMAFFNAMHPFRPTELLYSPAGGRQWRRSGRMADTSGATKRGHYNHVHVGFAEGGVFDQGGLMKPGMTGINLTRKPEAVLDPAQTRAYQAHAEAVSGGAMDLSEKTVQAIADALASRPNVLSINGRQAGQLSMAGAAARRTLGGRG